MIRRRVEALERRFGAGSTNAAASEHEQAEEHLMRLMRLATAYELGRYEDIRAAYRQGRRVKIVAIRWALQLRRELERRLEAGLTEPPPAPEETEEYVAELRGWFEATKDTLPCDEDGLFLLHPEMPWVRKSADYIRIGLRGWDRLHSRSVVRDLHRLRARMEDSEAAAS